MDMLAPTSKQQDQGAPWPMKPAIDIELSQETRQRIEILANKQLRNFPRLNDTSIFGEHVSAGYEEGPLLLLEDHRGIELMPDDRVASLDKACSLFRHAAASGTRKRLSPRSTSIICGPSRSKTSLE